MPESRDIKKEIYELHIVGGKPGTRLPSERQLALDLDCPQTRVHRAIRDLANEGVLVVLPRFGAQIADPEKAAPVRRESWTAPHEFAPAVLQVMIEGDDRDEEAGYWRAAFDAFMRRYPFFRIETTFVSYSLLHAQGAEADLIVTGPYALREHGMLRIDTSALARRLAAMPLSPGVAGCATFHGAVLGVPLIRTSSCWWVGRQWLERCGVAPEQLRRQEDIFALGMRIKEQSEASAVGYDYRGVVYHAAPYGVAFRPEPDGLRFPSDRLEAALAALKEVITPLQIFHMYSAGRLREFAAGEIGLVADYASFRRPDDPDWVCLGFPLEAPDGFGCATAVVAQINASSRRRDDLFILLEFLLSREGQGLLIGSHGGRFSVLEPLYREQKRKLVHLPGSDSFDYDNRGFYSLLDKSVYNYFGNQINNEVSKYICRLQSLPETIARLQRLTL